MRIATANARRRDQLRYWAGHPFAEEADGEHEPSVTGEKTDPTPSEGTSRRSHPATVNTFSSIARSAIYETQTQAGPSRTVYSPSDFGDDDVPSARVPKVPVEVNQSSSFECPFCRMILQSAPMKDRNAWKRHVYRDLRPYVCTFTQCSNPDKLYATRREWVYHEMQMHRRRWNCRPCNTSFETKELMASHLRSAHAHHWEEQQLPTVLDVSEAPIDGGQQQACPICNRQFSLSLLMEHIAEHMEKLALFVLPAGNEDAPDELSSAALSSLDSAEDDTPMTWTDAQMSAGDTSTSFYNTPMTVPTPISNPSLTSPRPESSHNDRRGYLCDQCGRVFDHIQKLK